MQLWASAEPTAVSTEVADHSIPLPYMAECSQDGNLVKKKPATLCMMFNSAAVTAKGFCG